MIQYCGPYTIMTSDATIDSQVVDSFNVDIERAELEKYECLVVQAIK